MALNDPRLAFALAKTRYGLALQGPSGIVYIYKKHQETKKDAEGKEIKLAEVWRRLGAFSQLSPQDVTREPSGHILELTQCQLFQVVAHD
jgi:hypothetical protein